MTARADFLDGVRTALGRPSGDLPLDPVPGLDERLVRLQRAGADGANLFASRAAAAGLGVHRCAWTRAPAVLQSLVASLHPACVVLDVPDRTLAVATAALAAVPAKVLAPRVLESLDPQFDADVGITGVLAAIAETGTLVVASDAPRSRGTFMIPPVHIAIVLESQIIADMVDLWPRVGANVPTALTLISGPSKTADIEGILVTGVHGPGAVHVLLIADESAGPRSQSPEAQGEQS